MFLYLRLNNITVFLKRVIYTLVIELLDNFQVIHSKPVKFKAKHFARLLAVRAFQVRILHRA